MKTGVDYKELERSASFRSTAGSFMVFPLLSYGPQEIDRSDENLRKEIEITVRRVNPRSEEFRMTREMLVKHVSAGIADILGDPALAGATNVNFDALFRDGRDRAAKLVADRYTTVSEVAPAAIVVTSISGRAVTLNFSSYAGSIVQQSGVKVRIQEDDDALFAVGRAYANHDLTFRKADPDFFHLLGLSIPKSSEPVPIERIFSESLSNSAEVLSALRRRLRLDKEPQSEELTETISTESRLAGRPDAVLKIDFSREILKFPFRPNRRHLWGLDESGRDVLVRCIYAFRIAMTFGFLLVTAAMVMGFVFGSLQGYFGGVTDLAGQRMIEIWSAIPFLYVIILMGDVFGKGFLLLLVCYGIFNWIGISYYIRAEFLKLRGVPYIEAAKSLGIPWHKIIVRHILPNSLTPIVTFFPFNLMGAVAVLSALDYLGYGLPPPTPSWGEMLGQAMAHRNAWWLVVYPGLCLFLTMLLTVFIGEGVRDAFDPKEFGKWRG